MALAMLPGCALLQPQRQWLVSAGGSKRGEYFAFAVDEHGQLVSKVPLPQRAHDVLEIPHQPGQALVFARRPDTFAMQIDFASGEVVQQFNSQADSHFYGHGVLSPDGKYLFTTENHFSSGRGIVVVRDARNYQVLDRFDSGGIGPHELALMPDGKTLVIANGGIRTHPDMPRLKQNLADMQPNLAYMQIVNGKILGQYQSQDHQLSIRHLDVNQQGQVFVGMQYQGDKRRIQPLIFSHQGEDQLTAFKAQPQLWQTMRQYTASVQVQDDLLAVSCPRGGFLSLWNIQHQRIIASLDMKDVAGLAVWQNRLVASNGFGQVQEHLAGSSKLSQLAALKSVKFDNHMTVIAAG